MEIVILAAGKGSRMYSDLPKVMQPLAGKPLLAHVLETARKLSPERICVVYGYGGDAVREALDAPDICWAHQEDQLGTGHAVQQALPALVGEGVALILYGDVPLISDATLKMLLEATAGDKLALLTVELDDPAGYGRILRSAAGKVTGIVEEKDATELQRLHKEINTGILAAPVFRLKHWLSRINNDNAQGEFYLTDIVALAVQDGVEVDTVNPARFVEVLGVNTRRQLAHIERLYQHGLANYLMARGVTLLDPSRIDIRGSLKCGRDVSIDINCIFEGEVTLADNVEIGANCILRNVNIGAGTRIAPFSHLEQAEIGENCTVGPYARLRPGTVLGQDVHVGNFVEIKNSKLDAGAKANHLSYLGDADIGQRVNIGAGTITCNYDGVNKFRTVIEDDVFIGSDTQLVAPVKVGHGATLGAGTTLTHDAPPDQLTISRTKQRTISGWKRPKKV